jgi:hypothetical protein
LSHSSATRETIVPFSVPTLATIGFHKCRNYSSKGRSPSFLFPFFNDDSRNISEKLSKKTFSRRRFSMSSSSQCLLSLSLSLSLSLEWNNF